MKTWLLPVWKLFILPTIAASALNLMIALIWVGGFTAETKPYEMLFAAILSVCVSGAALLGLGIPFAWLIQRTPLSFVVKCLSVATFGALLGGWSLWFLGTNQNGTLLGAFCGIATAAIFCSINPMFLLRKR